MDLQTSVIDLDSIEVKQAFPEPDLQELLYLANSIAELGGLIYIPIVRQIAINSYELISGFFEFQAFVKAREICQALPDRIRVYIANDSNEHLITKQLEVITELGGNSGQTNKVLVAISNLASTVNHLKQDIGDLTDQAKNQILVAIDSKFPTPLPPLEAFNRIQDPRAVDEVNRNLSMYGNNKRQKIIRRLQEVKEQNPNRRFENFNDVINALGKGYISKEKMLDIIDAWN